MNSTLPDERSLSTRRRSPLRWFVIITIALVGPVLSAPTASALSFEFWPLVESADGAVWGTVNSIDLGDRDRLITIDVHGRADLAASGGYGQLRVLERCGRYPDRTPLRPGHTGLFLYQIPSDTSGEWPHPDGWLVAGGFFPAPTDPADQTAVTQLVRRDFTDEARRPEEAISLLSSETSECRRLALEWLRRSQYLLSGNQHLLLTDAFQAETEDRNLYLYLDLFLVKNWDLAGTGLSTIVLTRSDPAVNLLTLHYRLRHRDANDEARLLAAYPAADVPTRCRLLKTYATLGLDEAIPWWNDALSSPFPELFQTAVAEVGRSNLHNAVDTLEVLLLSPSAKTRRLALGSLAARADQESKEALERFLAAEPAESIRREVEAVMKHPFRHGSRRLRTDREE